MRCFLGIPLPKEIRDKTGQLLKNLKMKGLKLVDPKNLHWTVKFFGDLEPDQVEKVKKAMDSLKFGKIKIEILGVGTFPRGASIRVIWLGVGKGKEYFKELLKKINSRFTGQEIKSEIVPHVTLARVKFIEKPEKLAERLNEMRNVNIGDMEIDRLVLYESVLTPEGPRYRKLKEVKW